MPAPRSRAMVRPEALVRSPLACCRLQPPAQRRARMARPAVPATAPCQHPSQNLSRPG